MKAPCFESKAHIEQVKSWLCLLLVCKQVRVASYKGLALHTKVEMKGLGRGKKRFQQNIFDLSPGIPAPDR